MADGAKTFAWIVGLFAVALLLNQMDIIDLGLGTTTGQLPATTTSQTGQTVPMQCSVAPTVQLGANNKYDSGQTNWGNWNYKLNGGVSTSDADGSFEVGIDSPLEVLVADGNSSAFYRSIWNPKIERCGINSDAFNDVVKFSTYSTKCFNENNDPMNASTYSVNLTIGQGGSRSVKCEMTGAAKTGMPQGGVLVLELNKTTYTEEDLAVTWDGATIGLAAKTPGAYTVGATPATTRTYDVPAFEGPAVHTFFINVVADSDKNPGVLGAAPTITAYGDSIVGHLYPKNCYEEEDVTPSEFRCGIEDIDQTFMSPGGTGKQSAAITSFIIPVT